MMELPLTLPMKNGIFVRGVTRGDGSQGDDVSLNLKQFLLYHLN